MWVLITIFAALMQSVRTALQKHLSGVLPKDSVNWVRYAFGLPFAVVYLLLLNQTGYAFPEVTLPFLLFCLGGAIAQIIATAFLIVLFSYRNFIVGTAYSKTEALLTAVLGAVIFHETVTLEAAMAVMLGVIGVIILSLTREHKGWRALWYGLRHKAAQLGLVSGLAFAFSALCIRKAALTLSDTDFLGNAAVTLVTILSIQVVLLGSYLVWKHPAFWVKIGKVWKSSVAVGVTSALGSIGWFTALAMQNAAYVKTVGQVEILFSLFITHYVFKEKPSITEIIGIIVTISGIMFLVSAV